MRSRVVERNMFYGASREIFRKAKELRKNMTNAEKLLWNILSNRAEIKVKFRRQHPCDIFILDFYCHKLRLAIELDGEVHSKSEVQNRDIGRTYELEKSGMKVIRFTNSQVFNDIESVKLSILDTIEELNRTNSPYA